jgi:DNA polymerase elongation subunit (family B)
MTSARLNAAIRDHAQGQAAANASIGDTALPAALSKPAKEVAPRYASCCLTVAGLERCVYVLPRERSLKTGEPVDFAQVYSEFLQTFHKHVGQHARVAVKKVERNYAFELPEVPREKTSYLKVVYDGKHPSLPHDLSGDTFSRIFGSHASPLENFLLKRDLMGPCWLRVLNARVTSLGPGTGTGSPVSWCQYEVTVENPKNVLRYQQASTLALQRFQFEASKAAAAANGLPFSAQPPPGTQQGIALSPVPSPGAFAAALVAAAATASPSALGEALSTIPLSLAEAHVPLPPPELVVMSLSMKTAVHPKTHNHEIVVLSMLTHKSVHCDGPSREEAVLMSAQTILRPLSQAQPLPADLKGEIAKLPPGVKNSIAIEMSERVLLNRAMNHIGKLDPDVIVGHNICGFDLDVLLSRCDKNNIQTWSRVGRLRRIPMPKGTSGAGGRSSYMGANPTAGRLLCDTYLAARELIRETTYTLKSLAFTQLKEKRDDIDPLEVPSFLTGVPSGRVLQLLQHTEFDARLALRLMFVLQVLPLTKQLTNLAGNLWSRSLRGARAERIEYLLLHEFHRLKYVLPDKELRFGTGSKTAEQDDDPAQELALMMGNDEEDVGENAAGASKGGKYAAKAGKEGGAGGGMTGSIARFSKKRAKAAYSGGLVLEPKKGLYDKFVLMLDFNSLYPSIIQEYNICFTTVDRQPPASSVSASADDNKEEDDGDEGGQTAPSAVQTATGLPAGITLPDREKYREEAPLPRVIRNLVEKRRQVKALLNKETDVAKRQALDIRQKALKILANSMYGCLGFSGSRFYAKPLAALVTLQGREILQRTVTLAETTLGCEVIYGDTDSIMIYTGKSDIKEVKAMGNAVKKEVIFLFPSPSIFILRSQPFPFCFTCPCRIFFHFIYLLLCIFQFLLIHSILIFIILFYLFIFYFYR